MSKFEDWSSHDGFNKWRISAGMVQLRKIEAAWEGYKAGVAAVNHSELAKENAALREALSMALQWIDALPPDIQLPAMPGFDRDYVNDLLAKEKL